MIAFRQGLDMVLAWPAAHSFGEKEGELCDKNILILTRGWEEKT